MNLDIQDVVNAITVTLLILIVWHPKALRSPGAELFLDFLIIMMMNGSSMLVAMNGFRFSWQGDASASLELCFLLLMFRFARVRLPQWFVQST